MHTKTAHGYQQTATKNKLITLGSLTFVLSLTACSTVSVSMQQSKQSLIDSRSNIITTNHISSYSVGKLKMAGINEKSCLEDLTKCLTQLNDTQFIKNNPKQLALQAELEYAKAKQFIKSKQCRPKAQAFDTCKAHYRQHLFKAIKYSYAYLFHPNLNQKRSGIQLTRLATELDIQTQDIYNTASGDLIAELTPQITQAISHPPASAFNQHNQQQMRLNDIKVGENRLSLYISPQLSTSPNTTISNTTTAKAKSTNTNKPQSIDNLLATSNLKMTGLDSISKRAGIGVSYVAQQTNRHKNTLETINEDTNTDKHSADSRIYPTGNLLLTAITQPEGSNLQQVLSTHRFRLNMYDPYRTQSVKVLNQTYPLATNYSANYALWLDENELRKVSLMNMLRDDKGIPYPHLYMLEPFDPNKRVIIMVHGLASSPSTWVNLTNDLLNDEQLRENYQVWQVFYSTNLPMLDNRYYIQQLIEKAYQKTSHKGNIPANKHSVIIAHSMGSVISRMMLSNDNLNSRLLTLKDLSPKSKKDKSPNPKKTAEDKAQQQLIMQELLTAYQTGDYKTRLTLSALAPVDKAVFIASPFRGTNFADKWFTKALRHVIRLPKKLTQNKDETELANNPMGALFLQNGANQLSDKSSFVQLTADLQISPKVTYHSIIGNYGDKGSDGVVPYSSSHLEGAKSETVIEGWHDIHTNPKTILQLRKILHKHLKQYPIRPVK